MSTELQLIEREVFAMREPFMAALTDQSINFDAEAGYAVQILGGNDYALKIARGNPQSVRNAVTNVAAIGISLNPARKQAYLVPRDGKICLDISYMGLIDIAVDSGCIRWGQARLVNKSDVFELNGIDQQPTHRCKPFDTERGEMVGVYAVAKTREGDYLTEAMAIADVFAVRDRSSAWKAWVANKKRCPWVTDEGEMIRKTVIKRAYKYWPKSDRMDRAIDMLNTQNDEGLAAEDTAGVAGAQALGGLGDWLASVKSTTTDAEAKKVWEDGGKAMVAAKDRAGWTALRDAVIAHRTAIRDALDARTVDADPPHVDDQFVRAMDAAEGALDA